MHKFALEPVVSGYALSVLILGLSAACGSASGPAAEAKERIQAQYDQSGKLTHLTYDRNGDGKVDTWGFMDGTRVVRVDIDEDGDGKPDTWEYHTEAAPAPGSASVGVDKTVERIERATHFDGRVNRREFFEAGALTRVEEDTDDDGKIDKWETYANGALTMMALDTQGRGTPDRRFVYNADGSLSRIEADADGTGNFRPLSQ